MIPRECGDTSIEAGRDGCPGAYAFFARYVLHRGESCLDVGGGMGRGREILLRKTNNVRAIDKDPRLVEFGVETGCIEDEGDALYDWVVSVDVVEHIEDDAGFMRHLVRVAKKGVFLATGNVEHHPDRNWPYHAREYTPSNLRNLVRRTFGAGLCLQLGGETYGANIAFRHLNPRWEHQVVVYFKKGGYKTLAILLLREMALALVRRK